MIRRALSLVMSALVALTFALPAFAEDQPPPRTPWTKADPASDKVVRWVVEGCAAYPVTAEGPTDQLASNAKQSSDTE